MKVASDNAGNTFPYVDAMEKVHAIAGPEFGFREECKVEIIKNMHGHATASRACSLHFGDFIRTLGFTHVRADQDVWIKEEDDCKSYQCSSTHVDTFLIIGGNHIKLIKLFEENFEIRHIEETPSIYLGSQ